VSEAGPVRKPGIGGLGRPPLPACRAGGIQLPSQYLHEPLLVVNLNIENVHVEKIEDRIDARTPTGHC
jgi:hypothetical protein